MKKLNLNLKTSLVALGLLLSCFGYSQTTTNYSYTGAPETWIVPACVTSIDIEVVGAEGGGVSGCIGGLGAEVIATIPVNPGDVIEVIVGGQGLCPTGGYNGGGDGVNSTDGTAAYGSCGGGGHTQISVNGTLTAVAAGGGGAGGGSVTYNNGGNGGCLTGTPGVDTYGDGGGGGTQTAGGIGGAPWAGTPPGGFPGGYLQGGDGGPWVTAPGGGGGGGYYGGGGGGNDGCCTGANGGGGGGGGSSLNPGGTCNAGVNAGDGTASITFTDPIPVGGTALATPDVICDGDITNMTLTGYSGVTIQWETAPTSSGPFVPVVGETTDNWFTPALSADVCYRAEVISCGLVAYSDTFCVTVNPIPTIDAGLDQTACNLDGVTLTAFNPDGATIGWDGGVTDGVEFDPPVGVTEYTVTATLAGCVNTDSLFVTINPYPTVSAGPDQTHCAGDLATLTAINPDGATISWDGGVADGIGFIPPTGTTVYTVSGDLLGCISYDDVTIVVNPLPAIDAGPDQTLCETDQTVLAGNGAGSTGTYAWTGGVVDGVSFSPPVGAVTYTVTGTDANGCQNTDDATITVNPLPQVSFVADEVIGCEPFSPEFTNTTDLTGSDCQWFFGNGQTGSGCSTVINKYKNDGLYDVTLIVTTTDGCTDTVRYVDYIEVLNFPEALFGVSDQEVTIVDPNVQFVNSSLWHTNYEWDFGDGSPVSNIESPSHTFPNDPNVSYPVTLTVWNDLGCTDSLTKLIIVKDVINFFIPNVFTPDGDEYNETFQPQFDTGFDPYDFNMKIYNRWGEVVFETYNATIGWDGTYGSQGLVEDGTYIWSIEFKETMSDQRHKHKGHVTILK